MCRNPVLNGLDRIKDHIYYDVAGILLQFYFVQYINTGLKVRVDISDFSFALSMGVGAGRILG